VYLPYCSRVNSDDFLAYLGKMKQFCDELQCPNICFVGDFNAGATNTFGGLLEDFCMENDFIISDCTLLPQDTFTYIIDAHNTSSWIDYFVSSFSVHQAMFNMEELTKCIYSDHQAVAVSIQCSHLPESEFDDEVIEPQPCQIDWLKVIAQKREDYYHESKNLLDQLQLPTEVRHCQNFYCADEKHLEEVENLYAELTGSLLAATSSAFKTAGKKNVGKFNIPGWSSVVNVKPKHQIAMAAVWLWANCNRPETGGMYRNMVKTKKDFQYSLRQCRKDVEIHKANGVAAALQADKTNETFWQKVNNKARSTTLPTLVGGVNGVSEIVKMWKDYFKGILNSENSSNESAESGTQHRLQGELSGS